jgi:hypothetical protein
MDTWSVALKEAPGRINRKIVCANQHMKRIKAQDGNFGWVTNSEVILAALNGNGAPLEDKESPEA